MPEPKITLNGVEIIPDPPHDPAVGYVFPAEAAGPGDRVFLAKSGDLEATWTLPGPCGPLVWGPHELYFIEPDRRPWWRRLLFRR